MSDTSDSRSRDARDREEVPPRARAQRPTDTERSTAAPRPRRLSPADVLYGTDREEVPPAFVAALPVLPPYEDDSYDESERTQGPLYGGHLSDRDRHDTRRSSGRPASVGSAYASTYVPPTPNVTGWTDVERPADSQPPLFRDERPTTPRPVQFRTDQEAFLHACEVIRRSDPNAAQLLDTRDPRPLMERFQYTIAQHGDDPNAYYVVQASQYLRRFSYNPAYVTDPTQRMEAVSAAPDPLLAPSRVAPAAPAGNFRLTRSHGYQQFVNDVKQLIAYLIAFIVALIGYKIANGHWHFNQLLHSTPPGTAGGWISFGIFVAFEFVALWFVRSVITGNMSRRIQGRYNSGPYNY